jgi:hypothetical protein
MTDILDNIDIHVACHQCDKSFEVSAAVVAESQELLDGGCPGTDYECPASVFAALVDRDALRRLADAWRQIERSVRDSVGAVSLQAQPTLERLLEAVEEGTVQDRDGSQSNATLVVHSPESPR